MELRTYLENHNACEDSLEWLGDRNVEQCTNECERGDWLLWLEEKLGILDKRGRVRIGAMCADTARHLTDDNRVHDCIDVCYRYAAGECTDYELASAAREAWAAASAAASAARAAAWAAAWAAESAASAANQRQTAGIVRREIGQQLINKLHELGVQ